MHPTSGEAKTWRHLDKEGYWRRRWWVGPRETRKQRDQLEHRWVWEGVHGEKLPPGFVVHHRDHNRANNAPENLEAMPRAQHEYLEHGRPNRRRVVDGVAEKQCSTCGQWFPLDHYYHHKGHAMVYCRACCNARKRERRYLRAKAAAEGRTIRPWGPYR